MKKLFALIGTLACFSVLGQAPIIRGPLTTNSPTVTTNIVRAIATNSVSHAEKLRPGGTLPALNSSELTNFNGQSLLSGIGTYLDAFKPAFIVSEDIGTIDAQKISSAKGSLRRNAVNNDWEEYSTIDGSELTGIRTQSIDATFYGWVESQSGVSGSVSTTGLVSRVSGYIAQPFNVTNTAIAVIFDSHGYVWPEVMTNMVQWRGLRGFTNGTEGGTSVIDHTNNWATRIRPWLTNFASGVTKVLIDGGFTIDQINGVAAIGGITNYINTKQAMYREAYSYGIVVVTPNGVPYGTAGDSSATDANNDIVWLWNNWLARAPSNTTAIIPDFARFLPNVYDSDTNGFFGFYSDDLNHPGVPRGKYLQAQIVDETLRGVLPVRPLPFSFGEYNNRFEWRNPITGALVQKLWKTNGAFQQVLGSLDGLFPASSLSTSIGGQFTGHPNGGSPAIAGIGRSGQSVEVIGVRPASGGNAIRLWDSGKGEFDDFVIGANMRIKHAGYLEFTNNSGNRIRLKSTTAGALTAENASNGDLQATITGLDGIGKWMTGGLWVGGSGGTALQVRDASENLFLWASKTKLAMASEFPILWANSATDASSGNAAGIYQSGNTLTLSNNVVIRGVLTGDGSGLTNVPGGSGITLPLTVDTVIGTNGSGAGATHEQDLSYITNYNNQGLTAFQFRLDSTYAWIYMDTDGNIHFNNPANDLTTVDQSLYVNSDVSALTFTDRSKAPSSLKDAYEIVASMKSKDGHVDHAALSPKAWGTRKRVVTNTVPTFVRGIRQPARKVGTVAEPDQSKRDLGMVVSAQAMVIQDLLKRIEALEKK